MSIHAEFKNLPGVIAKLQAFGKNATQAMGRALYETATEVEADSKEQYVPVHLGTLRDSIHTTLPQIDGFSVSVAIVAGGPAAPYAVIVHEDTRPRNWRKPGTGPKYIEKPLMQKHGELDKDIHRSLDIQLGQIK